MMSFKGKGLMVFLLFFTPALANSQVGEFCKFCPIGRLEKPEFDAAATQAIGEAELSLQESNEWLSIVRDLVPEARQLFLKNFPGGERPRFKKGWVFEEGPALDKWRWKVRILVSLFHIQFQLQRTFQKVNLSLEGIKQARQNLPSVQTCDQAFELMARLQGETTQAQVSINGFTQLLEKWMEQVENQLAQGERLYPDQMEAFYLIMNQYFASLMTDTAYKLFAKEFEEIIGDLKGYREGRVIPNEGAIKRQLDDLWKFQAKSQEKANAELQRLFQELELTESE